MANEITTTSHNDITNPTLAVPYIQRALSEKPGFWRHCKEWNLTGDFAAPAFVIPREVSFWGSPDDNGAGTDTEFDATEATDLSNTAVTTAGVTVTPGEYGVALEVTKNVEEDSLSAIDLYGLLEERMLHVISLAMTYDFLALFASLSNSVGVSGSNFTVAQGIAGLRNIRTRGTDADAVIGIFENQQAADIEDELVSQNASVAVFAQNADRLIQYAPTADNGMGAGRQVFTFRNAPVFVSGQCATANSGADVVGAFFCPSTVYNDASGATTFHMGWKRLPMFATDQIVLGRSTQLVMSARAGFGEGQDGSGSGIVTGIS